MDMLKLYVESIRDMLVAHANSKSQQRSRWILIIIAALCIGPNHFQWHLDVQNVITYVLRKIEIELDNGVGHQDLA